MLNVKSVAIAVSEEILTKTDSQASSIGAAGGLLISIQYALPNDFVNFT